ncbi:MAG: ribulose phosphate epimerase [Myxococcales bacterium]|nr:ribulose phosphate epimerase [Myxococcales bacterium]
MQQRIFVSVLGAALLLSCGDKDGDTAADETATGTSDASTDASEGSDASTSTTTTGTETDTTAGDTDTTTTTTTTSDSSDSDATGCEFVCETDMPGGTIECDNWAQDCGDGEKCAAWANDGGNAWNSTKCVMIMGDGVHGDSCTAPMGGVGGEDTCAEGNMCWNIDSETGEGTCVELCTGSAESASCGPPDTLCFISNDGVLNLCLLECDPLVQNCQGNNEVCIPDPMGDTFVCVLDASGGDGVAGTPCEFINSCNPGNMCLNVDYYPAPDCQGSIGCCGPFCDLQNPLCPEDPPGLSCESFYEPGNEAPGFEDVGICIVPQ